MSRIFSAHTPFAALDNLLSGDFAFMEAASEFLGELDRMRGEVDAQAILQRAWAGSSVALMAGLSLGYVVMLTRGGLLIASLVSSMPVWRLIDPIPILAAFGADQDDDTEDDESLDGLIRRTSDEAPTT